MQLSGNPTWIRFVTAMAVLIPVLVCMYLGGIFMVFLAWVFFLSINYEFFSSLHPALAERRHQLLIVSASLPAAYQLFDLPGLASAMVLGVMLIFALFVVDIEKSIHEIDFQTVLPAAMLGLCYPGLMGSLFVVAAHNVDSVWIAWLLGTVICTDTFAYFGGRAFGGEKFAPRLSPNKTVSGAIAGVVGGVLGGLLLSLLFSLGSPLGAVLLGLLASVLAVLGDLTESMIKRIYGVKDMGSLLPGHGGVFDRVDALLFAIPVLFLVHLV